MKTRFLLTTIASAALFLTACNTDENPGEDWDGRIHLSSSVATLTRTSHELDDKIANNEKVWLYVEGNETEASTQYYGKELTATGNNTFAGADELFFPANETSINLYAFHINEAGEAQMKTNAYPTVPLTHKVDQNQQSTSGTSGYAKSDLLSAKASLSREDAKTNVGAVALPFKHLLSKIEVVLLEGAGKEEMDIQNVEILNTKLQGTFTPSKTAAFSVSASGDVDGSTHNPIQIDKEVTTDESAPVLNEAIIIPQEIANETPFIRVTLSTGGELIYKLDKQTTFHPGTKYRYTITAKLTGLTVTSSIDPWIGGETPATGNAEMQ